MKKQVLFLILMGFVFLSLEKPAVRRVASPQNYALFFAVEQYDDRKLPTLKYPIQNARDIMTELENNYGFKCEMVVNPTYREIKTKLNQYAQNFSNGTFDKDGQLFIFFTGHGERESGNGFFLTKDTRTDELETAALSYSFWRNKIDEIPCKHILVAIDACKSGSFDPATENMRDPTNPNGLFGTRANQLSVRDGLIQTASQYTTRLFVSSGAMDVSTPDKSEFAYQFLEALRSRGNVLSNSDNVLNINELGVFLSVARPRPMAGKFGSNEPSSDFLFISGNSGTVVERNTSKSTEQKPIKQNEDSEWLNIKNSDNLKEVEQFKKKHPNSIYLPLVETKLTELREKERLQKERKAAQDKIAKENEAWQVAQSQNTLLSYQDYLTKYPKGDYVNQANRAMAVIMKGEEDNEWLKVKQQNTVIAYQTFLGKYPQSTNAGNARKAIDILQPIKPFELEVTFVKGGTFTMGCTDEQGSDCQSDESPAHQVSLSDFYIGKYEVTQSQWEAVMGNNPSNFKGDNLPVEQVSWDDVQEYLTKLNKKTGKKYRLPTEAEWEYAARGGNKSEGHKYSGSNSIGDVAWYDSNSGNIIKFKQKTHPVGKKQANELGLYDMSGNVWEWCSDWYDSYSSGAVSNPTGAATGSYRVVRGGSWYYSPQSCRVADRYNYWSTIPYGNVGFRVAFAFQ